jgi:hypothetical protein
MGYKFIGYCLMIQYASNGRIITQGRGIPVEILVNDTVNRGSPKLWNCILFRLAYAGQLVDTFPSGMLSI